MPNGRHAARPRRKIPISLALQGGGAHGAFTWGVLDRLLECERFSIRAVSGTSAGAMNAVVLADGLARGGPQAARAALAEFWDAVGKAAGFSPFRQGLVDRMSGRSSLDHSPGFLFFDGLARYVSPYDVPVSFNPLRDLVAKQVDFERINGPGAIAVHLTATNVRTGLPRVFSKGALSVDAVLASACLPQLFPAVEIDGEIYWDGGFTGNPSLLPLIDGVREADVFLIQVNPVARDGTPRRAREIINRMNEITFNASLVKELAALHGMGPLWPEVAPLAAGERARPALRLHRIDSGAAADELTASSKLDADPRQLTRLFDLGRAQAETWFAEHAGTVGRASTLDLEALFGPQPKAPARTVRRRKPQDPAEVTEPEPGPEERAPVTFYPFGHPLFWSLARHSLFWPTPGR